QASPMGSSSRVTSWLIGAQVAAAVALVASAALLMTGARTIVNNAYDGSHVALLRVRPLLVGYNLQRSQQFQRDLMLHLNAVAGVESAIPYTVCGGRLSLPEWTEEQSVRAACREVGPRYFAT